jgi:HK97 family phage major capsid protein
VVAMEEGAKSVTFAALNTIPTAAWRLEAGNVATSDPAFRSVVVAPKSLAFMFKISRELLADSPNLQDALLTVIGQAFAKEIDRVGLLGTGTNPEPRGLLNTSGIQSVTNGAAGASLATTKFANLFTATQAILAADAPMPTAAIMSPRSLIGLGQLADSTGQPLRTPDMLNGIKLIASSQVPNNLTVTTSTDCSEIFVGDFSKLFIMSRENMSVQLLREAYAGTGELAFVCHARIDIAVQYAAAFAAITGVRP